MRISGAHVNRGALNEPSLSITAPGAASPTISYWG
ncbi:hypothetical protein M2283_008595 [Streptomyces pseudovenezuelae]|uniref:Uncharacterized protein n=1 Tax=Streptomyces pseudovenezuelae TaxID=67350 RepID=A0ABT6LY75_9ACTN|nr:hypothetical protein [Streptomyces pseudovenezuelae]